MGTAFCVVCVQHPAEQHRRFCTDSVQCRFCPCCPILLQFLASFPGLHDPCSIPDPQLLISKNRWVNGFAHAGAPQHCREWWSKERPWARAVDTTQVHGESMLLKYQRPKPAPTVEILFEHILILQLLIATKEKKIKEIHTTNRKLSLALLF